MAWHEWSVSGVYFSPYFLAVLIALAITAGLRLLLNRTAIGHWIWHEALFDTALFVCVLGAVVAVMVSQ